MSDVSCQWVRPVGTGGGTGYDGGMSFLASGVRGRRGVVLWKRRLAANGSPGTYDVSQRLGEFGAVADGG